MDEVPAISVGSRRNEDIALDLMKFIAMTTGYGKSSSPTGGVGFLKTCQKELEKSRAKIVTVIGRYFAMDRDRRWDRTKKAWDAIVLGRGEICKLLPSEAVDQQYKNGKTDEFMPPLIFSHANEQRVRDDDSVLFFNFRADRARQLS